MVAPPPALQQVEQVAAGGAAADLRAQYGSKLFAAILKLRELGDLGEKVLVFVQFDSLRRDVLEVLRLGLPGRMSPLLLEGSAHRRSAILRRFRSEGGSCVLVLSLEQCSAGLDLTTARHALLLHPMLAESREASRDVELQAVARLRRPGQLREVHIWRLVTTGTIEEFLLR